MIHLLSSPALTTFRGAFRMESMTLEMQSYPEADFRWKGLRPENSSCGCSPSPRLLCRGVAQGTTGGAGVQDSCLELGRTGPGTPAIPSRSARGLGRRGAGDMVLDAGLLATMPQYTLGPGAVGSLRIRVPANGTYGAGAERINR